ncbi:MAG: glutathione peroxidase [Candidatus Pseudobacter hemicellulosilyticus]|uniref:Glutathione peroxidase n=1 Tax=Candidatus Pseudobacter hemicellulosilyticus TaxID=3121375 RepID=A0AAJ6BI98_9BACT|nr:MAG: glutathione peroxidase [Pseudobacter sp.]
MTGKQKILKAMYPVLMGITKLFRANAKIISNKAGIQPRQPLYAIPVQLNNGESLSLEAFKGKKILLVNTASDCGYTNQYEALQELQQRYAGKLLVLGFPANDFKEQEKGDDASIAQFCKINFGVSFPLVKKSRVIPVSGQHAVFQWLTHKEQNGWNEKAPSWNFSKYLVNESGVLTDYFDPSISPLSKEVVTAIEK